MEDKKTIEVYMFILKEINGWLQEDIDRLTLSDIDGDPIFERLKKI